MDPILLAVIVVGGIGLLCGLLLAVFSIIMAVPVDEKAEAIAECLPGANCGACGFSGCSGYASALSKGETTNTALCNPGGAEASSKIAEILGVSAGSVIPMAAVVLCNGHNSSAKQKMNYIGVNSCRMAQQLYGGPKECIFGCIGLGDCVKECPFDAIHICNGIARVNPTACKGCKKCVNTCPKGLIELLPLYRTQAAVLCKNHDKGVLARKECDNACIGCMKCTKVCQQGAVTVENFVAHVDHEKCNGCGLCTQACPVKCINLVSLNK